MSSIRLYKHQVEKLKQSKSSGLDIIKFAIKRYDNKEFINKDIVIVNDNELIVYSIRERTWNYSDAMIRLILDLHLKYPKDYSKQINNLDDQINSFFSQYQNMPYIIEEQ